MSLSFGLKLLLPVCYLAAVTVIGTRECWACRDCKRRTDDCFVHLFYARGVSFATKAKPVNQHACEAGLPHMCVRVYIHR